MKKPLLLSPIFWCLGIALAIACRYTVRDIGFVDLRGPEYMLFVPAEVSDHDFELLKDRLRRSNVRLAREEAGDSSSDEFRLIDAVGRERSFRLSPPSAEASPSAPAEVSADENREAFVERVESQLFSGDHQQLIVNSIDSFAQILVIEGSDSTQNERANSIAETASAEIRRREPLLPRPLQYPVRIVRIPAERRGDNRLLIWSLGLETDHDSTILAIVYGRGRLAGEVMLDDQIDSRETLAQLLLVGESCECETDRAWLDERVMLFGWSKAYLEQASELLGFDPEHPLVIAEVRRIVSRGPSSSESNASNATSRVDAIDRLLLGYGESELGSTGASADVGETESDTQPSGEVIATIHTGDGWDFDEPSSPVVSGSAEKERQRTEDNSDVNGQEVLEGTETGNSLSSSAGSKSVSQSDRVTESESRSEGLEQESTGSIPASFWTLAALGIIVLAAAAWMLVGGKSH